LFFKLLFNVKLMYSMQVIGPWLWGITPIDHLFSSVVGQRKGPSGANAPPVHGIKKCLALTLRDLSFFIVQGGGLRRNSTVMIFFHCPPLKTNGILKAPLQQAKQQHKFWSPPPIALYFKNSKAYV
jgi:hypothetical protein